MIVDKRSKELKRDKQKSMWLKRDSKVLAGSKNDELIEQTTNELEAIQLGSRD